MQGLVSFSDMHLNWAVVGVAVLSGGTGRQLFCKLYPAKLPTVAGGIASSTSPNNTARRGETISRPTGIPNTSTSVVGGTSLSFDDELQIHFLLHASLDVCDEYVMARSLDGAQSNLVGATPPAQGSIPKAPPSFDMQAQGTTASLPSQQQALDPRFMGKLLTSHRWASYGFQTNSGLRVLVVTLGEGPLSEISFLCTKIYEIVSHCVCNPFYPTSTLSETGFSFQPEKKSAQQQQQQQQIQGNVAASTGPAQVGSGGSCRTIVESSSVVAASLLLTPLVVNFDQSVLFKRKLENLVEPYTVLRRY